MSDQINRKIISFRENHDISSASLAAQIGISRQAMHLIENGKVNPSVGIALKLAKIIGTTVEDLFGEEEITDLLFTPAHDTRPRSGQRLALGVIRGKNIGFSAVNVLSRGGNFSMADALISAENPPLAKLLPQSSQDYKSNLVISGCDPALGLIEEAYLKSRSGKVLLLSDHSTMSLERLRRGEAHIAGIHFSSPGRTENVTAVKQMKWDFKVRMFHFSKWEMGWMVAPGNPKSVKDFNDLYRKDILFAHRETGSGVSMLISHLAKENGTPKPLIRKGEVIAAGHFQAAQYVLSRAVDLALGPRAVAQSLGLDFIPLALAQFDFIIPEDFISLPAVDRFLNQINSSLIEQQIHGIAGYEILDMGKEIPL